MFDVGVSQLSRRQPALSQDHVVRVERTSFTRKKLSAPMTRREAAWQAVHGVEAQFDRAHTETRPLFYGVVEGSIDDRFTRIEAINAGALVGLNLVELEFSHCLAG